MTVLKNLKFKVSSPEQSERLQKVLFGLGYSWADDVTLDQTGFGNTDKKYLYAYLEMTLTYGETDSIFDRHSNEETDTEAFISLHTDKPFEGLEEAYNSTKSVGGSPWSDERGSPWFVNNGTMPTVDDGADIDIMFRDGDVIEEVFPDTWTWELVGEWSQADIIKWRYHNAADYYKQPKTLNIKADKITVTDSLGNSVSYPAKPKAQIAIKPTPDGSETKLLKAIFGDAEAPAHNKYSREVKPGVFVDVYDVIRAFNVIDPCLQHLLKKALATGKRGHKDAREDYQDIVASAQRALDMHIEWSAK